MDSVADLDKIRMMACLKPEKLHPNKEIKPDYVLDEEKFKEN